MPTASDVAKYFLSLQEEDAGDLISNLKLQKLLYYSQGLYLASEGKPLFADDIVAWKHGPVVPGVYQEYKHCGADPIPVPDDFDSATALTDPEREFLDEIYSVFGQFSAWKLRNMTHAESPYTETERDDEIPHEKMARFFKSYIK